MTSESFLSWRLRSISFKVVAQFLVSVLNFDLWIITKWSFEFFRLTGKLVLATIKCFILGISCLGLKCSDLLLSGIRLRLPSRPCPHACFETAPGLGRSRSFYIWVTSCGFFAPLLLLHGMQCMREIFINTIPICQPIVMNTGSWFWRNNNYKARAGKTRTL